MTRTVYVGKPTKKESTLYAHVLTAQEKTIAQVRVGQSTMTLDAFCRKQLGGDMEKLFFHGLGHGVGTQVHEWPPVNGSKDILLEAGMVVTIEPGVYEEGAYGIRIEDDVLVTKQRPLILTKTSKVLKHV